jgi:hypothetical protein
LDGTEITSDTMVTDDERARTSFSKRIGAPASGSSPSGHDR